MVEANSPFRMIVTDDSGGGYTTSINNNSHRNDDGDQYPAAPVTAGEEIGISQCEKSEGVERAQAAAGFGDIQGLVRQMQNIAFAQDGEPQHAEHVFRQKAGNQLQRQSHPVINESGQRDHEGQQKERVG